MIVAYAAVLSVTPAALRTSPRCRPAFLRVKAGCITVMLAGARFLVGRAGLEPAVVALVAL
jgi:hypothetical protein